LFAIDKWSFFHFNIVYMESYQRGLDVFQKISLSLMSILVLVTFIGANLHAVLWQSSDWLVSTVLPAVVVNLTNQERADSAAAPLQRSATLDYAASLKAQHMADNEYFSHFSPSGVSPWYWFNQADYVFAHAGENLAIHFTDSSEVVEAWMKSPAHRENIVNGVYTEIGVGTAKGTFEGYDTVYVVQLFGTPAALPTPQPLAVSSPVETPVIERAPATPVAVEVVGTQQVDESDLEVVMNIPDTEIAVVEVSPNVLSETGSQQLMVDEVVEPVPETLTQPVEVVEVLEVPADVVVVQSPTIATSSGLAVGNIVNNAPPHAGGTVISIATQPNELLQIIYLILTVLVVSLLGTSIVVEARSFHLPQVAYSFFLLFGMAGLWYAHSLLTTGAVII
jgi:hypothetical protein